MEDGRKKPKIKPHEEEEDWDWKKYQHQFKKDEEDNIDFAETYTNIKDDSLEHDLDQPKTEGEKDAETQGKQEQAKGREDSQANTSEEGN